MASIASQETEHRIADEAYEEQTTSLCADKQALEAEVASALQEVSAHRALRAHMEDELLRTHDELKHCKDSLKEYEKIADEVRQQKSAAVEVAALYQELLTQTTPRVEALANECEALRECERNMKETSAAAPQMDALSESARAFEAQVAVHAAREADPRGDGQLTGAAADLQPAPARAGQPLPVFMCASAHGDDGDGAGLDW